MSSVQVSAERSLGRVSCLEDGWLELVKGSVRYLGFAVVEDVLDESARESLREAMYTARERIWADIGRDRLEAANELGVLRLMMKYEPSVLSLLANPVMQDIVDNVLSDTAILHLQNGFILPPTPGAQHGQNFQQTFHRDFPRHMEGYFASLNILAAIDPFTSENGGTLIVPGTHQLPDNEGPSQEYMQAFASPVECPAGSFIVFDSTLWHAAGVNCSDSDRVGINHQFTRSYIKQQVDYVRGVGAEVVEAQPPRVQQMLGWYTRVVTSLDEYYQPADRRLYRGGQG